MTRHSLAIFALCLAGVSLYSGTLDFPFVFDDLPNITKKSEIRVTSFDPHQLRVAAFSRPCPRRPVANLSFALDYALHGYRVRGYRVVNIAIHLLNGILVYFLSLALLRQAAGLPGQASPRIRPDAVPIAALASALIFVAHPLQIQSVVYIVQRMNSMATLFYLSALLLYVHGRGSRSRLRRWVSFALGALGWVLALGSKETATTLPIAIALYEWFFFRDLRLSRVGSRRTLLLAALVVLGLGAWIAFGHPVALLQSTYEGRGFTAGERVLTQLRVVPFYASLVVFPWPSRLNLLHGFRTSHSLLDPATTLLSLLVLILTIGLAIKAASRHRLLSFCALWFFLHLALESSVIGLEMVFEYRLYLPMVGCACMAAALLFHLTSRTARWVPVAIASLLVLSLGLATHAATRVWRDETTLWSTVVARNPESPQGHVNVGLALAGQGRLDEAIEHYREALRIQPDYEVAHNDLGIALRRQGKLDEAIAELDAAVRVRPNYPNAHYNLGNALASAGRLQDAVAHYGEALRMEPDFVRAHYSLALVLDGMGRRQEAIDHLSVAVQLAPGDSLSRQKLAELLMPGRR